MRQFACLIFSLILAGLCIDPVHAQATAIDPAAKGPAQIAGMDLTPFARVVTCDPARQDGARSSRIEEFRPEDVFLEWEVPAGAGGAYTVPVYEKGLGCIGLQWPERRLLSRLALEFASAPDITIHLSDPQAVRVQYWSSQGRLDGWSTVGQTPWQGAWAPLPGKLARQGAQLVFNIDQAKVPEFVNQSGTQKVRWILPASPKPGTVRRLAAQGRTPSGIGTFRIELEKPRPGVQGQIELYNGYLLDGSGRELGSRQVWDMSRPCVMNLRYTALPKQLDRTILRLQLPEGAFAVGLDDVLEKGCVYLKDYGLFVTREPASLTLADYKKKIAGRQTVLERVRVMPDQIFVAARQALINPPANTDPIMLSLACDNRKFVVERNGAILTHSPGYWIYEAGLFTRFGSGKNEKITRHIEDNWLPISTTTFTDGGLVYRQRAFVAPYDKETSATLVAAGQDRRPLCVVEYSIENPGAQPAQASLSFDLRKALPQQGNASTPWQSFANVKSARHGAAFVKNGRLFAFLDAHGQKLLTQTIDRDTTVRLQGILPPRANARYVLYIPGYKLSPADAGSLKGDSRLLTETREYWKRQLAPAMQMSVPETELNNIYRASQVHCLMAARSSAQDGKPLVEPWIASMTYGPLDTEAQAVINGMDMVGQSEFARRGLDYFLSRYNAKGALANGYTLVGTGQNLWALGEHYQLSGDHEWLKRAAPTLTKACQWIMTQRSHTQRLDPSGQPVPESGLVPPGVLADWERYAYYFYGQGYYYAGLNAVARALGDIHDAQAPAFRLEAEKMRRDILRAYAWNQARMPAFELGNGTWVPAYPSSLYCFGLTSQFYTGTSAYGHDVEVGGQHLINQGVIDPASPDAEWIGNYMEDKWFFYYPGLINYGLEKMTKDWFNYGGFSKLQQYYTRNADVSALRDDVKPFIRTYFNSIFPLLSEETMAFWEHFNCVGAWNKTHETGWFLRQTRLMLAIERDGDLWLAPFITNNWMKDGMVVDVKNAPTCFGPVSYRIQSHLAKGYLEAMIDPPTRSAPRELVIRLRHPEGKPMRQVSVDGKPCTDFDPAREIVRLRPAGPNRITVKAYY